MDETQDWCHFNKVFEMPYGPIYSSPQPTNLISLNNYFGLIAIAQGKTLNLYYIKTLISSLKSNNPFKQFPFKEELSYISLSKDCSQLAVGQKTQVSIVNLRNNSKFDIKLETFIQHLEFKGSKLGLLQGNGKFELLEFEKSLQKLKNVEFFTYACNSKNIFIVQEDFIRNYDLDSMKIVQQSRKFGQILSIKQSLDHLFAYSFDESTVHILIFNKDLEPIADISDISLISEGTDPLFMEDLKKLKIFFEFIENKRICVFTTSAHPSIEVLMVRDQPEILNFEENYEGHGYLGEYEKGRFLKTFRGFCLVCCEHDLELKEFNYRGEGYQFLKPPIAVCLDNLGGLTVFAMLDLRAEFLTEENCNPAQYDFKFGEANEVFNEETEEKRQGNQIVAENLPNFTPSQPKNLSNLGFFATKKDENPLNPSITNSGFFVKPDENKDKKTGSWMTNTQINPSENPLNPSITNSGFFVKPVEDKKTGSWMTNTQIKPAENPFFSNLEDKSEHLPSAENRDQKFSFFNVKSPNEPEMKDPKVSEVFNSNKNLFTNFSGLSLGSSPGTLFNGFKSSEVLKDNIEKPQAKPRKLGQEDFNTCKTILRSSTELFGKIKPMIEKIHSFKKKINFQVFGPKNALIDAEALRLGKLSLEIYPKIFSVSQKTRDLTLLFSSIRKEIALNQENNFNSILNRSLSKNIINLKNFKALLESLKETSNSLKTLYINNASEKPSISLLHLKRKQLISDKLEELRHKLLNFNYLARSSQPEAYSLWPEHNFSYIDPQEYKSLYKSLIKPQESIHFTQSSKKSSQFTYKSMTLQIDPINIVASSKPNLQKSPNNSLLQSIINKREKLSQEIESFKKSLESRKISEASNKPVENQNPLESDNKKKVGESPQNFKDVPKVEPANNLKPTGLSQNIVNTGKSNAKPEPTSTISNPFQDVKTDPAPSFFVQSSNKAQTSTFSNPVTSNAPSSFFVNNSAPINSFPSQLPTTLASNPFENAGFGQKSSFVSPSIPKMEGIASKSFGVSSNPFSGFSNSTSTPTPVAQPKEENNSFFKPRK